MKTMKKKTHSVNYYIYRLSALMLFGFSLLILTACGSGRNSQYRIGGYADLQEVVNGQEFEIENDWAMPLRGNRINLIGNPNHIRFEGDSVDIHLPYFGVRQSGGTYGGRDGGIIHKGPVKNLEIVENPERQNIVLKFRGQQGNEDLQFFITLFPNGRVSTNVSSSQRDAISYQGDVERLREE